MHIVKNKLNTTPEILTKFCQVCSSGSTLSGAFGAQGHYANALAALYIATGQDAACVSESSVANSYFRSEVGATQVLKYNGPSIVLGQYKGCIPFSEVGKSWAI